MKTLPPPGPGDNFFTICKRCGRLSYTNKSSADYCQDYDQRKRSPCNPRYHRNGKQALFNTSIITSFGEEVDADKMIAQFYKYYEVIGGWSDPVPERILFLTCEYYGPLPKGTEIMQVGSNVLRKTTFPQTGNTAYQFKSCFALTKQERDVWGSRIVTGAVTTFYKAQEEHPIILHDFSIDEAVQLAEEQLDYNDRRQRIEEAGRQNGATDASMAHRQ